MAYQTNGVDISPGLVPKSYFFDLYPSLSNIIAAPALWGWGDNSYGQLGINNIAHRSSPVQTIAGGTNWKQVIGGNGHVAAIKTDGTLWLCGFNDYGQLGTNNITWMSSPTQTIASGTNWKQVASTYHHTAAIKTDGTLWMWGRNNYGQLGDNTSSHKSSPVQTIAGGTNWKQVACGYQHTSAIKTDGTLWSWGFNTNGQIGDNTAVSKSSPVQTITGGTNWKQVACGGLFTAAIKSDSSLWTWGNNGVGQLGDTTIVNKSSPIQTITGGANWKVVSAGSDHIVAVKTDGTLWSWGYNLFGQLGDGTSTDKSSPIQNTAGGSNWRNLSCGLTHTTAIKTDGTLWLWGNNGTGRLGDNTRSNKSSPIQTITGGTNWKSTAGGGYNTFAIADSSLYSDSIAQPLSIVSIVILGPTTGTTMVAYTYTVLITYNNGVTSTDCSLLTWSGSYIIGTSSAYITVYTDIENVYTISAVDPNTGVSASKTTTITGYYGNMYVYGSNSYGQLGNNTNGTYSSPVQTIIGGSSWKYAACGLMHSAFIKTDGTLWVCGYNTQGQLGDNSISHKSSPIQTISGGTNWKQVACGCNHTSAIKTDGTLWSWGYNNVGELGDNTSVYKSSPVQTVAGGTNWSQVACGGYFTMAVKTDGTLWGWGSNNFYALGTGGGASPIQLIAGTTNWKQVSCGKYHSSAIKTDGTLWSCGYNMYGTMGDGTSGSSYHKSSPVQTLAGGTNWKQVACGDFHTTAIKTDGTLWCWGRGNWGQIGNNNVSTTNASPVQTAALGTNWKTISCGYGHNLAIKTDGTMWGWGLNTSGQIGDGTATNITSPKQNIKGGTGWKFASSGRGSSTSTILGGTMSPIKSIVISGPTSVNAYLMYSYTVLITFSDNTVSTDCTLLNWSSTPGIVSVTPSGVLIYIGTSSTSMNIIATDSYTGTTNTLSVTVAGGSGSILLDWGRNDWGQLGNNSTTKISIPSQTVAGGTNWKQSSCGYSFAGAIKTDGTLWTWGNCYYGQLGENTINTHRSSPVQTVAGGTNWSSIACGEYFVSAIKTDGTLWMWGANGYGQLGTNDTSHRFSPVQTITGGTNWLQSSGGTKHTAAIKTDGTLWLWGMNFYGELGTNDTSYRSSPIQTISGGTNWKQVSCGKYNTAAIKTDGTLWTWGYNGAGRLGDGTTTDRRSPAQTVAGGTNWKQVSCGYSFASAVKTDGTLWLWGPTPFLWVSSPTQIIGGGNNWVQTSQGDTVLAAIKSDGTLWCIGGAYGTLGNNTTDYSSVPIQTTTGISTWSQVSCGKDFVVAVKT